MGPGPGRREAAFRCGHVRAAECAPMSSSFPKQSKSKCGNSEKAQGLPGMETLAEDTSRRRGEFFGDSQQGPTARQTPPVSVAVGLGQTRTGGGADGGQASEGPPRSASTAQAQSPPRAAAAPAASRQLPCPAPRGLPGAQDTGAQGDSAPPAAPGPRLSARVTNSTVTSGWMFLPLVFLYLRGKRFSADVPLLTPSESEHIRERRF